MAETNFATGDALTQKLWSEKVIRESIKDIFFAKLMGKSGWEGQSKTIDPNAVVTVREELTKSKGDQITIPLRMRLTNDAIDSENVDVEGNEEEMIFEDFAIKIYEKANAVKAKSKMALKRPAFDLRTEFKDGLSDWLSEYIDIQCILALSTNPTSGHHIYGGDATSTATIESADVLTTTLIGKARRKAKLNTPKVLPIMVKGKPWYVMLVHDYQMKEIRGEDTWINAQRYANVRGETNPIFTAAAGVYEGVVIQEYERVRTYSNWGSGAVNGARAVLLGRQALALAWGQRPQWYEKLFQYNRIPGVATDLIWGTAKPVFAGEDFGCITVDTAYAED